jgi:hypothetical protein
MHPQDVPLEVRFVAPPANKSRDPDLPRSARLARIRYRIETVNGQLAGRYRVKRTWARDLWQAAPSGLPGLVLASVHGGRLPHHPADHFVHLGHIRLRRVPSPGLVPAGLPVLRRQGRGRHVPGHALGQRFWPAPV